MPLHRGGSDAGTFPRQPWQTANRRRHFHALRHTAVTNVYRASRDPFLAQRFARQPVDRQPSG